MQQHYTLTRTFLDDAHYTTITASDDDAINCAYLLASGFNTISRNFINDFAMGVVDTKAGTVQYDGKIEKIDRADKRRDVLESAYAELQAVKHVLFDAGVETIPADAGVRDLLAVKRAMSAEISDLKQTLVELAPARNAANEAARAELIKYVKGAHVKLNRIDAAGDRDDLQARFRGMLDVLAKFLVAIGEADADEGHAAARRLCGISDA